MLFLRVLRNTCFTLALVSTAMFAPPSLPAREANRADDNIDALIHDIDRIYRGKTSIGDIEMTITRPRHTNHLKMRLWSRGLEDTFIRVDSPRKLKGVTTLKLGGKMWNYIPKINKVVKISGSMMLGSWMGSDFTNDDMVKESTFQNDYTYRLTQSAHAGEIVIEFIPKPNAPVVWGKLVMTVNKKSRLPERIDYFEEGGDKVRALLFTDVRKVGGRTIPTRLVMRPLNKEGHKTEILYENLKFDTEIPHRTFSVANLKSRR